MDQGKNATSTSGRDGSTRDQSTTKKVEDKAQQAREKTKDKARQAEQKVEEKAGQMANKAEQKTLQRADEQKQRAVHKLDHVAGALRKTGDNLRDENEQTIARYADRAADGVERVTGYLNERRSEDLLHEAEQFARREPALFIGGAFALGLMGARFLRSSRPQSQHQRDRRGGPYTRRRGDDYYPHQNVENPLRGPSAVEDTPHTRAGAPARRTEPTGRTAALGAASGERTSTISNSDREREEQ